MMDPAAMAAAAAADPMLHALPVAPVFIAPPSYETTLAMATTTIAILPSLHPRPNHSSIRALERDLFDKLQAIQSSQSEEWGFRGLAEQPAEYALKSATPWTDAPNPGPHRPVGLNAQLTRDAETIFDSAKMDYLSQLNVTQAIINALNVAVPKEFKRGETAAGTIMGASPYRNNNNPCTILLALRDLYGRPSPAEKQANNTTFAAPWNPAEPIETYFDRLEDCYVTALIASPPFTIHHGTDDRHGHHDSTSHRPLQPSPHGMGSHASCSQDMGHPQKPLRRCLQPPPHFWHNDRWTGWLPSGRQCH